MINDENAAAVNAEGGQESKLQTKQVSEKTTILRISRLGIDNEEGTGLGHC